MLEENSSAKPRREKKANRWTVSPKFTKPNLEESGCEWEATNEVTMTSLSDALKDTHDSIMEHRGKARGRDLSASGIERRRSFVSVYSTGGRIA